MHAEKEIPYLTGPVIDDVNLLNSEENRELNEFIRSQKNILQMQVWITSLEGDSIEGVSYRAASKWALGTEQQDNGILLLIAPAEKRMRIDVGRGLEGDIPDILAGRILDSVVRPQFREGRYYAGIRSALDQLVILAGGGPQAAEIKTQLAQKKDGQPHSLLAIFFFIFIMIASFLSRIFGRRGYGRSSGIFGAGGGGWGGGGGGWSGGGGSFGGGGSSSSW